jgi:hypothetical protein
LKGDYLSEITVLMVGLTVLLAANHPFAIQMIGWACHGPFHRPQRCLIALGAGGLGGWVTGSPLSRFASLSPFAFRQATGTIGLLHLWLFHPSILLSMMSKTGF